MKKITILKAKDVAQRTLTVAERELKYEQLSKTLNIDKYHLDNFLAMEIKELNDLKEPPQLMSLLIRELLRISSPIISDAGIITQINRPTATFKPNGEFDRMYASNTILKVAGLIIHYDIYHDYTLSCYPIDFTTTEQFSRRGLWNMQGKSDRYILDEISNIRRLFGKTIMFNDYNADDTKPNSLRKTLLVIYDNMRRLILMYDSSINMAGYYIYNSLHNSSRKSYIPNKTPKYSLNAHMKKIDNILEEKITNYSYNRFIDAIYSLNISHLYYSVLTDPNVGNELIKLYDKMTKDRKIERRNIIKHKEDALRSRQLQLIANKKFNTDFQTLPQNKKNVVNDIYNRQMKIQSIDLPYNNADIKLLWSNDEKERQSAYRRLLNVEKQISPKIKVDELICKHLYDILNNKNENKNLSNYLIQNYSSKAPIRNYYHCKLCGEELAPVNYASVLDRTQVSKFDGLSLTEQRVWRQVSYIINSYVNFTYSTFNVVRDISLTVTPHISDIENKIQKIKSYNEDTIISNLKLYTAVYTYAILIHIINENKFVSFKAKMKQHTKVEGGKREQLNTMLFTIALNLINKDFNHIINSLNFNISHVKKFLIKAFNEVGPQKVQGESNEVGLFMYLDHDPMYKLIASQNNTDPRNIETVLSMKYQKMLNLDPNETIYDNVAEIPKNLSFNELLKYFKRLFALTAIPLDDELSGYYNRLDEINEEELNIIDEHRINRAFATGFITMKTNRQFVMQGVDISLIYGPDGKRIKWDIVVGSDKTEYLISSLQDIIGTSKYDKLKIVDYKSSSSGIYKSKTNLREVETRLNLIDNLESFYNYYQFKCPVSGNHNFTNDLCTKCKITKNDILRQSISPFQKWKTKYKSDRDVNKISGNISYSNKYTFKSINVKVDTSIIGKLSTTFNLPYNALLNLGFSEGYDHKKIMDTTANPIEADKIHNDRAARLMDYYNYAVRSNIILSNNKTKKIPMELIFITEKFDNRELSGIPRMQYLELDNQYHMEAVDLSNYVLMKLYNEFIKIMSVPNYEDIMKSFVEIIIKQLINYDSLFGIYNVAKLKESIALADYQTNDTFDGQEEYEVDQDDEFGEMDHSEFSMEGMDFEDGWENLEGADV